MLRSGSRLLALTARGGVSLVFAARSKVGGIRRRCCLRRRKPPPLNRPFDRRSGSPPFRAAYLAPVTGESGRRRLSPAAVVIFARGFPEARAPRAPFPLGAGGAAGGHPCGSLAALVVVSPFRAALLPPWRSVAARPSARSLPSAPPISNRQSNRRLTAAFRLLKKRKEVLKVRLTPF